jgi:hypothetical protein
MVVAVLGPTSEWRAQRKLEVRRQRIRAFVEWTAGLGAAVSYWAVLSVVLPWQQIGEIIGLFTVVPVGMVVGCTARGRIEGPRATRARHQ